jgi:hypothetical protein
MPTAACPQGPVSPGTHAWQPPFTQCCVPQLIPQMPQFASSLDKLAHAPLHGE